MNFNLKNRAFYTSFVESLKYEKFASFLESIKPAVTAIDLAAFEALQSDVKALVEAKVDYETYSSYRKFRWPEADAKKSNGDYDLNFNQILNILDTKVADANNNASKIQQAIMVTLVHMHIILQIMYRKHRLVMDNRHQQQLTYSKKRWGWIYIIRQKNT